MMIRFVTSISSLMWNRYSLVVSSSLMVAGLCLGVVSGQSAWWMVREGDGGGGCEVGLAVDGGERLVVDDGERRWWLLLSGSLSVAMSMNSKL